MTRAFSLLETLIAIGVLAGAIVAAIGVLSFTLRHIRTAGDELVAAHLAAEGIEIVRNLRDTHWLQNMSWDAWRAVMEDLGCVEVAYHSAQATLLPCGSAARVLEVDARGRYCYACAGTPSPYTRVIEIETGGLEAHQLRIRAVVEWTQPAGRRELRVEDVLYDWR